MAPKGASEYGELAVSLKRYPDSEPESLSDTGPESFGDTEAESFSRLQKKTGWVEATTEC